MRTVTPIERAQEIIDTPLTIYDSRVCLIPLIKELVAEIRDLRTQRDLYRAVQSVEPM